MALRDTRKLSHNSGDQFRHSDHPRDNRSRASAPASRLLPTTARSLVESLSLMSLAGGEAERLLLPAAANYGDAIDLKMVRNYLEPPSELEFIAEVARLGLAARRLVMAPRRLIETVATALSRSGTLSGDKIIALLNGMTIVGKLAALTSVRSSILLQSKWSYDNVRSLIKSAKKADRLVQRTLAF